MRLSCIAKQNIYLVQSQPKFISDSSLLLPSLLFLYRTLMIFSKTKLLKYDAVFLLSVTYLMPPTYLVPFSIQMNEILT